MKAMIFAAGKGTRLGSITDNMPKALLDIKGKTALRIAVEKCASHGFDDIIINIHHFAEMMEKEINILRKEGFTLTISDESEKLLETGGGLYKAKDFFDSRPFLVYNVDIINDLDLAAFYNFHLQKKGLATLAARHRKGNRFFLVNGHGLIKGWRNNATGEEIIISAGDDLREIAFSGMHVIDPDIFNYMHEGIYTMTDLYLRLAKHHKIFIYTDDSGFWGDIGTPENLEKIRNS